MEQEHILPKGRHKPKTSLRDYIYLIFGPPKGGKTTFANGWDGALFLETEPGTAAMEAASVTISNWTDFTDVIDELQTSPRADNFSTIIVDTVDILWDLLAQDICNNNGWVDLNDPGFGRGYNIAKRRLTVAISALRQLDKAIIFISHERRIIEMDDSGCKTGVTVITSDLPNSARRVLHGYADFILRAEILEDGSRVLRTRPLESEALQIECGCRGELKSPIPEFVPLNFKAWHKEFAKAFRPRKAKTNKAKTNKTVVDTSGTQQEARA